MLSHTTGLETTLHFRKTRKCSRHKDLCSGHGIGTNQGFDLEIFFNTPFPFFATVAGLFETTKRRIQMAFLVVQNNLTGIQFPTDAHGFGREFTVDVGGQAIGGISEINQEISGPYAQICRAEPELGSETIICHRSNSLEPQSPIRMDQPMSKKPAKSSTRKTGKSSRISGFHALDRLDRLEKVAKFAGLDNKTRKQFQGTGNLPAELAERLIENVIGTMNVPIGVATNMIVDGEDVLVPMATEESSVVAAVCNAARQCRASGGIITSTSGALMIAQIQLVDAPDPEAARLKILEHKSEIATICDAADPILVDLGGGFRDLEVRVLQTEGGPMVITHIIVDTRDAMGANAVNTMAERLAPYIALWTGGRTYLRILSNLADRRLARARAVWKTSEIAVKGQGKQNMPGKKVRDGMMAAYHFAAADPWRATTHNKGIMNGISAVTLATGNDTRAIEAGAHAFAARDGHYSPLTRWEIDKDGNLVGSLEMPLALGIIGGATKAHPTARACLEIMGVTSAEKLQRITAAVGLCQNFAALKALATVGVQKGHMALHAQNIAMMAGATGTEIDQIAHNMTQNSTVRLDIAVAELKKLRNKKS
jgi:hydroxymethylglutaryl-CoA reductase